MAKTAPTLVAAGAPAYQNVGTTAIVPALPTGWQPGDLLVLVLQINANTTWTSPSGWTQRSAANNTTSERTEVWLKWASSGETAPSLTPSASSTVVRGGFIVAIRGVDYTVNLATGPLISITSNASGATSLVSTAISPIVQPNLALLVVSAIGQRTAFSQPTNFSTFTLLTTSTLGNDMTFAYSTRVMSATGTTGAPSTTPTSTTAGAAQTVLIDFTIPQAPLDVYGRAIYNESALVGYYRLDESSGTNTYPADGVTGLAGNVSGPVLAQTGADQPAGYAMSFDGVNDIITIPDHNNWSFGTGSTVGTAFTVECMFKLNDTAWTGTRTMVSKASGTAYEWALRLLSPTQMEFISWTSGGGTGPNVSMTGLSLGTGWHHIAAVYDPTTTPRCRLYIDGTQVGTSAGADVTLTNGTGSLGIGFRGDNTAYFVGLVDEVAIYNAVLTATTIQDHWRLAIPLLAILNGNTAEATQATSQSSIVVTTAGSPIASAASGDYLIAAVSTEATTSGVPPAVTTPSGWTKLGEVTTAPADGTSDSGYMAVFSLLLAGAPASTYTFAFSAAAAWSAARIFALRGADPTTLLESAVQTTTDTTTPYTAPSLTTVSGRALATHFAVLGSKTTAIVPPGSPWIELGVQSVNPRTDIVFQEVPTGGTSTGTANFTSASSKYTGILSMPFSPPKTNQTFTMSLDGALVPAADLVQVAVRVLTGSAASTGTTGKRATRALAGTQASAGTVGRVTGKATAGVLASSSLLDPTKLAFETVVGTLASSGQASRQAYTSDAGALASSGALARQPRRLLAGALTPAGALSRRAVRVLSGSLVPTGSVVSRAARLLTSTLTSSGALSAIGIRSRQFAGTLVSAGTLTRKSARVATGSLPATGVVAAQTRKALSAVLGSSGSVASRLTYVRVLAGALFSVGNLTRRTSRQLTSTTTPTAALRTQTTRILIGTLTSSGTVAVVKALLRSFGGTLTSTGALLVRIPVHLSGSILAAGSLASQARRTLSGSLSSSGATQRAVRQVLSGNLASSGVLSVIKALLRTLTGALVSSGVLIRQPRALRAGTVSPAGTVANVSRRTLAGILGSTGQVKALTSRRLTSTLASSGALLTLKAFQRTLTGTLTSTAQVSNQLRATLRGTLVPAGAQASRTSKRLLGTLTTSGVVVPVKASLRTFAGSLSSTGALAQLLPRLKLQGSIQPAGSATIQARQTFGGTLRPTGQTMPQTVLRLVGVLALGGALTARKLATRILTGVLHSSGALLTLGGTLVRPGAHHTRVDPAARHVAFMHSRAAHQTRNGVSINHMQEVQPSRRAIVRPVQSHNAEDHPL